MREKAKGTQEKAEGGGWGVFLQNLIVVGLKIVRMIYDMFEII